jgi:Asp-tRNA(Asn)/Glu-tRNA(Gln) amidotransferase A subunit family amidase
LTSIANMSGVPAVSVPMRVAQGELPAGLQIIGPHGSDSALLVLACAYQQQTGHVFSAPPLA